MIFEELKKDFIAWYNKSTDKNYRMRKHRFGVYLYTVKPVKNYEEWEDYLKAAIEMLRIEMLKTNEYEINTYTTFYKADYRKSAVIYCKKKKLAVKSSLPEGGL